MELLLKKGSLIGAANKCTNTPLHLASWGGHTGVADLLLRKGASIEAIGQSGKTPLHFAAQRRGHTEIVELLLKKGASIEARNNSNKTPLDLAVEGSHADTVQLLKDKAAELAQGNHT